MSPQVIAALLGVLGGVLLERVAGSWGRLWCEPSGGSGVRFTGPDDSGGQTKLPPEEGWRARSAEYSFQIDLFNGKEIPVGLRDISLVFRCGGVRDVVHRPRQRFTSRPRPSLILPETVPMRELLPQQAALDVVDLSPRQWVHLELYGRLGDREEIRLLTRWYRVEFVGHRQRRGLFESKTFCKTIASRPPLPDPWRSRPYI